MTKQGVHLYSTCWNEVDVIGFFLRHYDAWVDRFVIFDDDSTDGTLDLLRAHPKVELRHLDYVVPDSFVRSQTWLNDNAWKESRGEARWVVVADIDEHYHLASGDVSSYLAHQRAQGVTLIPALGFGMHALSLPADEGRLVDVVQRGRPRRNFNKLGVFDPDAVLETGFDPGRHVASPVGDVRLPARDELMLWHYKHLGFDRWHARDDDLGRRRGERDRMDNFGHHYNRTRSERADIWAEMRAESSELGGDGFAPDSLATGPLWWRRLERVRPS